MKRKISVHRFAMLDQIIAWTCQSKNRKENSIIHKIVLAMRKIMLYDVGVQSNAGGYTGFML
jgi:hypothetical protein